jgi:hypothetical protein
VDREAEGTTVMTDGETGLEVTVEMTKDQYPEIMRIVASDGEVDTYLEDVGVSATVFAGTDAGAGRCASERAAVGSALLYAVEVGEVTDASESEGTMTLRTSAVSSLTGSLSEVGKEGLLLADCLDAEHPDAAARLRETFELLELDIDRLRRATEHGTTGA